MVRRLGLALCLLFLASTLYAGDYCYKESDRFYGIYGGYYDSYCEICGYYTITGHCSFNYHDYSGYPGIVANGKVEASIWFDDYDIPTLKITFSGGPVIYTAYGENYTVFYNDLYFTIMDGLWGPYVSDVGGGITVNGIYYPGDEVLYDLLM